MKASSSGTDPLTSRLLGAGPSLASAKGHRYAILRALVSPPPIWKEAKTDPTLPAKNPCLRAPGTRLRGPHWPFFEALGRLIGLLHGVPLWGSAQACSSCWVCRRRKERRIIPLQVSVSVAALHFQWLGKVTSRLENTTSLKAAAFKAKPGEQRKLLNFFIYFF